MTFETKIAQALKPIYAPRVIVGDELGVLQRVLTGAGLSTSQSEQGAFLNPSAARMQAVWMQAVEWACKAAARQLAESVPGSQVEPSMALPSMPAPVLARAGQQATCQPQVATCQPAGAVCQAGDSRSGGDVKQWHERAEKMDDASIMQAMKAELTDLRAQLASAQRDAEQANFLLKELADEYENTLCSAYCQVSENEELTTRVRAQLTNPTGN